MTTDELREAYLDYFAAKGCERRPSDVLVPRDDPTVLFTPAGMNQFKAEFMGLGDPSFKRATTCQKCIRTGDIENVGKTGRHMTFFEMLGNFSFGDYFKREAIHWAWEFLTKRLAIPADRLTITVYLDDDEAYNIWRDEVRVPASRITRMGEDDNFWPASAPSQGPNGVCGPCSEIFYHYDDGGEVEIWNLVFTQFNRVGVHQLEPLPNKNIDTGMGLERAASCLQGVRTNFEIDIFKPLVAAASDVLGVPYKADTRDGIRIRRAADHARALTFTIHENVRPGPEKQGYVIRRLLRRAVLDAYQMGRREPFLHELIPLVADLMARPYPELVDSVPRIRHVVREEEERFLRNLENGLSLLEDVFKKTRAAGSDTISGRDAFALHATHGIPVEIVESLAADRELKVDRPAFDLEVDQHAATSRGSSEAADVFAVGPLDTLRQQQPGGSTFLGYESVRAEAEVIGIVAGGTLIAAVEPGTEPVALVLDRSPFYGESGGQVGDLGVIVGPDCRFRVEDTQRDRGLILHIGRVEEGVVRRGDRVEAVVDVSRRDAIRRAHSATHVLHHALHQHLGKHAQQAGSKVEPDRLRFDFSNPDAVGRDRLRSIEQTVNERVLLGEAIRWRTMPIDRARSLGAMALFGEKYPDNVRVVEMGEFSRELCGGTHLENVGQIGLFKVVGEESVASGTRRITALTGVAALDAARAEGEALAAIASTLKVPPQQAADRIVALLDEIKTLKRQSSQRREAPKHSVDDLLAQSFTLGDVNVIVTRVEGVAPDELRRLIDLARRKAESKLAVMLLSASDGKVVLAAGLTPDVIPLGMHAGNWIKQVAPLVGGGGGGKPEFAQAGGKTPEQIPAAIEKAKQTAHAMLKAD